MAGYRLSTLNTPDPLSVCLGVATTHGFVTGSNLFQVMAARDRRFVAFHIARGVFMRLHVSRTLGSSVLGTGIVIPLFICQNKKYSEGFFLR